MVKRYPVMSDEAEDSQVIGEFVRYSDYAKLEEALRECVKSLCEYVDNDSPGKTNERKANAQKVVARVFEVLGDA